jgi:hypothetical protein
LELKLDGSQSVGLKNIKKMAIPIDNHLLQKVQDYSAQSETLSSNHVYELQEEQTGQLEAEICRVGELSFDKLIIPPYQRPYKWTAKNVNQLISDLLTFKHQQQYRLGTLVLHNDEIVDGQQRIITLALLIRVMYEALPEGPVKDNYKNQLEGVRLL